MNAALNGKNRTILDESQIQTLAMFISALRKTKDEDTHAQDVRDCRDVLFALSISGYAIVPQGALDSLKDVIINREI